MTEQKDQPVSESLERLVETLLPLSYAGPERRQAPRRSVLIPVHLHRLNDEFEPTGAAEEALICNVSITGAMFVHTHTMLSRYVSIDFPEQYEIEPLVMEVIRNRPMGTYFEIAGTFISGAKS